MAIKNLKQKLDYITELPRIGRTEVSKILKECYKEGVDSWKKHVAQNKKEPLSESSLQ
jgi:hypothetical protein